MGKSNATRRVGQRVTFKCKRVVDSRKRKDLRNIRITQQGGCGKVDIPTDEKEKEYPEATMWGILPAKGVFVNHARNVVFDNVEVETIKQDERPVFIKLDAE